jgi:hypothetical protein
VEPAYYQPSSKSPVTLVVVLRWRSRATGFGAIFRNAITTVAQLSLYLQTIAGCSLIYP